MLQAGWLFFFWNLAALVDSNVLVIQKNSLIALTIICAAILCLLLPARKAWPFFLFSQVIIPFHFMPMIGNSVTVRAVVVFFLFLDWLWASARSARIISILAVIHANASLLRVGLLLVYLIAGIHKLNPDFMHPNTSCVRVILAQVFGQSVASSRGFAPDWTITLGVYLTLAVELLFPYFLFFRRSRPWVLIALIGFHVLLGPKELVFTLTQFGFFCLFIPRACLAQWTRRIRSFTPKEVAIWCLLILSGIYCHLAPWLETRGWAIRPFGLLSTLFIIWALGVGIRAGLFRYFFEEPRDVSSQHPRVFLWAALITLVCLGLAPYYGLRTVATLSMYSNLRVQNGSNHFFLPSLSLFSDGERLIEIDKTNSVYLQRTYIQDSQLLTKIDLERLMVRSGSWKNHVTVSYHSFVGGKPGETEVTSDATREGGDFQARPYWQKKLMAFRPIPKGELTTCQW